MNTRPNITYLDSLPELQDMESVGVGMGGGGMRGGGPPPEIQQQVRKFIRPAHHVHPDAGMEAGGGGGMVYSQPFPPTPDDQEEEEVPQIPFDLNNGPTCLVVAQHVQMCPLCSKFYKNDRTLYVIVIIVLIIICLLLLKKILETN